MIVKKEKELFYRVDKYDENKKDDQPENNFLAKAKCSLKITSKEILQGHRVRFKQLYDMIIKQFKINFVSDNFYFERTVKKDADNYNEEG